jgi:ubiquinone/menaquinone biosynthesis C-methylase UbiE
MPDTITTSDIREGVRATFDAVAVVPTRGFRFPVGPLLARQVGYPEEVLSSLPLVLQESFTGLAYLHPNLTLRPGEHALDLGSGGGLDAILAARAVAPTGIVTGIDFAGAMIARARAVAANLGVKNAAFVQGSAEAIPLAGEVFDAVLVNGLLNLCPDKAAVAREIFRVLRPGGRGVVAEITYTDPLPPAEVRTIDDWFR